MHEELIQAEHSAEFLARHILAAHKIACRENPVAEIVLFDLIAKAGEIEARLKQLKGALKDLQIITLNKETD